MKTTNPVLDSLVETQTQLMNNWMDSAKKMQNAFTSGNPAAESNNIYKEFFEKQMAAFNNLQKGAVNAEGQNVQDFFRNWFNQQATYAKQMADFTQSIQNSFSNFGKPAHDYLHGFNNSNSAFSNIYNSWLNAINTSYDAMSRNMNGTFSKDVFSGFMQGNQVYAKMQEFFHPMAEAMQKGKFDLESYKQFFTTDHYKNLAKQMFGNFYNDVQMNEVYSASLRQLQEFFTTQQNLGKEYYAQLQNVKENFPLMFANEGASKISEFYGQLENIFGKTFEPLLKVANPGKEKENAEMVIALLDKLTAYTIKQAELQLQLQNTAKKGVEKIAEKYAEKFSDSANLSKTPDAKEMYSEWVKVNEELFTDLFSSDTFSKVKGETLNLSMEVKKHFEKQFESAFQNYPIVFKSEVEELQKTIHDLRKQVKELQARVNVEVTADDDKSSKKKK
jgi:polyhydroxyalkanoate synthesis regulator phasin